MQEYDVVNTIQDETFIDTDREKVVTKEMQEARARNTIYEYLQRDSILQGKVVEIRPANGTVYAVLKLEGKNVLIPAEKFVAKNVFNKSFESATKTEQVKRMYQVMRACIGAKICYVLTSVDRKEGEDGRIMYRIMGDRLEAMRRKRQHFFYNDSLKDEEKVGVGKVVSCNVLTVGEQGIRAEAFGVDFYIENQDLGLTNAILDARDWFSPGDTFDAMVRKLHINEDDNVYLRTSVRMLEHEAIKDGYKDVTPGSTMAGYVSSYNKEAQSYTVILAAGAYARIAKSSVVGGETLAYGDAVSVEVKSVAEGFVIGSAMKIGSFARHRKALYSFN